MTVLIDGTEYVPMTEAAEQLATTETKILMLLKQKALQGDLIEGSWFVTSSSLAGYDPQAAQPGRLPDCRTSCSGSGCGCH